MYAFGEIILVVIGILIAITLNSRHNEKISRIERDSKLLKLRHVIYSDSISFMNSIDNSLNLIVEIDSLQSLLGPAMEFEAFKHFVVKFNKVDFRFRTFKPNLTVYNELINSASFSKIEDLDLKDRISALYSYYDHFGGLIRDFTNGFIAANNHLYNTGIVSYKYFILEQNDDELKKSYEAFLMDMQDPEKLRVFENYLFSERSLHESIIGLYQSINNYFIPGLPIEP